MTDSGRCTSDRCGSAGCMRRRGASWIISAVRLAEKVGITKESVTHQLITTCHLLSELFKRTMGTASREADSATERLRTSELAKLLKDRPVPAASALLDPVLGKAVARRAITTDDTSFAPSRTHAVADCEAKARARGRGGCVWRLAYPRREHHAASR